MGRRATIDDAELMDRLARVFRDTGYEGASLAALAEATGLKKASLYHRFPGGKEQMAQEVLAHAGAWLEAEVLSILRGPGAPSARIDAVAARLNAFYSGGRQACLLNMLSSAHINEGPFVEPIRQLFEALIDAFAKTARDAGLAPREAKARAERAVIMLQGSLVLARGLGRPAPFRTFLKSLPHELLA